MRKRLTLSALCLVISVALTSCMTTQFLADPNKEDVVVRSYTTNWAEFKYGSAASFMKNSSVLVGAWIINYENRSLLEIHMRITNLTDKEKVTPDDIQVYDSTKRLFRIFNPEMSQYYFHGSTPIEASSMSTAFSSLGAAHSLASPSGGTATTYYNGYSSTTYYNPTPNYAALMYSNMAVMMALQSAHISNEAMQARIFHLYPQKIVPYGKNFGKFFTLPGSLPIEIHVFALGDHHVVSLDKPKPGSKREKNQSQRNSPRSASEQAKN